MNFTGKVVLVTGASRGIGRECARQFAARGAHVAVHYGSNQAAAEETLNMLAGDGHIIVQADVADPAQVRALIDSVTDQMGALDVLVNNAGIFEEHPLADVDYDTWLDTWQRILNTNLLGAANATYWAAHYMMTHGGGRIVNVSSRAVFRGKPEAPAYVASKAGMNAMSQSLAVALAPHGIYITQVAPGVVETDMARDLDTPAGDAIRAQSPLNRVATPEDVAYTVVFLASEGAEFLTGTIVDINGASYLRS